MQTSTTIDELIDQAAHHGVLSEDAVQRLFQHVFNNDPLASKYAAETTDDAIIICVPDGPGLHMRPGGWVLDVRQSAARTVVAAAVIGGLLAPAGLDQLPGYVLPAVIPLLFDLKQVRLTRRDKALLLELRLSQTAAQMTRPWPPGALYSRLPAGTQARISLADFSDFLDTLSKAGFADRADFGEVALRAAGDDTWIRLSLTPQGNADA